MYPKKLYVIHHEGDGNDLPWLEAVKDLDEAIDGADENGVKVAVYTLASTHRPSIKRGLEQK